MNPSYREHYRGRRVLITGGAGFIGSNLARVLVDLGADILLVDSLIPDYGGNLHNLAGIESRGFVFAAPLALALGAGFLPIRKPGKLPAATIGMDYELEYGTDRLEIHADAIEPGERVLLVDDLLATGGTANAAASLLRSIGAHIVEAAFVVELPDLGGRLRLESAGVTVRTLIAFPGH